MPNNDWEEGFDKKAGTGIFGAHMRDEEADWEAIKSFLKSEIDKAYERGREEMYNLFDLALKGERFSAGTLNKLYQITPPKK